MGHLQACDNLAIPEGITSGRKGKERKMQRNDKVDT